MFLPVFTLLQTVHWIAFRLDDLFYPGWKQTPVREPLFIVGIPRSGTTLLHRVLARDTERFTTLTLWELLFAPSVVERKIVNGLCRVDRALGGPGRGVLAWVERRAKGDFDTIHASALTSAEEDYFLLLPVFACYLLTLPFPFLEEVGRVAFFDRDFTAKEKARVLGHYRACLQKHLYVQGPEKRLLSKNPSFSAMIGALSEEFPDCRIVACVRDPLKTVPSLLSSMETGMRLFDNDPRGTAYRDHLLAMLEYYYQHLAEDLPQLRPGDRHDFVEMVELTTDLEGRVLHLYETLELPPGPAFQAALREEAEHHRAYRSGHRYTLEQFGLSEEELRQRFPWPGMRFRSQAVPAAQPAATT